MSGTIIKIEAEPKDNNYIPGCVFQYISHKLTRYAREIVMQELEDAHYYFLDKKLRLEENTKTNTQALITAGLIRRRT